MAYADRYIDDLTAYQRDRLTQHRTKLRRNAADQLTVGERCMLARVARGLKQDDVARAMEVSRHAVMRWEADRGRLVPYADWLGVALTSLERETCPHCGGRLHCGHLTDVGAKPRQK